MPRGVNNGAIWNIENIAKYIAPYELISTVYLGCSSTLELKCPVCPEGKNTFTKTINNIKRSIKKGTLLCSNKAYHNNLQKVSEFSEFLETINYKLANENPKIKHIKKDCVFIKCPKGHIFKRSPYKMGFNNDTGKYMRCTHKECEDRNYKNKFAHRGKNRKKEQ